LRLCDGLRTFALSVGKGGILEERAWLHRHSCARGDDLAKLHSQNMTARTSGTDKSLFPTVSCIRDTAKEKDNRRGLRKLELFETPDR
jgi:hypothetical protein